MVASPGMLTFPAWTLRREVPVVGAGALPGVSFPLWPRRRKRLSEHMVTAVTSRRQSGGSLVAMDTFGRTEAAAMFAGALPLEDGLCCMLNPQEKKAVPVSVLGVKRLATLLAPWPRGGESRRSHNLRSANKLLLSPPKTNRVTEGGRAFTARAPLLWNQLPLEIKRASSVATFKSSLKTHYYRLAFN